MSNNKQSSVEWLKNQLEYFGNKHELQVSWTTVDELFEQAKSMHKEEIIDSFFEGAYGGDNISGEQYYNETFGGNNEI